MRGRSPRVPNLYPSTRERPTSVPQPIRTDFAEAVAEDGYGKGMELTTKSRNPGGSGQRNPVLAGKKTLARGISDDFNDPPKNSGGGIPCLRSRAQRRRQSPIEAHTSWTKRATQWVGKSG